MGAATVPLAIFGYCYHDRMGGLLEELSEPEEEMTRKANGSQGNRGAKKAEIFVVNVSIGYILRSRIYRRKQQKSAFKITIGEPCRML